MKIICSGKSTRGKDHSENEDSLLIDRKLKLFAVADGVSIPKGGKKASQKAVKYLKEVFSGDLKRAVEETNKKIVEEKRTKLFEGYTTLTAIYLDGNILKVCNVGDSPAFLFRKENLEMLTMLDVIPGTSTLIQAIGQEFVIVHSVELEVKEGDCLIFASDGITDVLNWAEVVEIVKKFEEPKAIVEEMIKKAERKIKAYEDDKTVIVIRLIE
jgi:serine/threonine protein phosphatase PrpC